MTTEQAIARLIVMMEKGQTENNKALGMAIRALEEEPVRCKDCRHWKTDSHCDGYRSGEDFCSWGEEQNK